MRRALLLLVAVVLLPLLAAQMGVCWAWFHGRRLEEEQSNLELGRAVGSAFETTIQHLLRHELAIGSALSALQPYSAQQATRFLTVAATQYPLISSWSWIDSTGRVLASSHPPMIGTTVQGRSFFQAVLAGMPFDLDVGGETAEEGQRSLVVARRIEGADGKLQGVVAATLEVASLADVIGARDRGERGDIALFDREGRLVFGSPPEIRAHADWTDDDPLLDAALRDKTEQTGTFHSPVDGEEHIAARVPMPSLGWVAGASRPVRVAMAEVRRAAGLVIGLNLVVAVLSVGAAATLSRRIIAPLERLQEHARALGNGDLGHRTEMGGIRELQELAASFNRMGARIHDAQDELAGANALLERRVAERTSELADTVRKLKGEAAERARAEQALSDSARDLEAVFSHTYTALALLDQDFNFIRVNEAYARADRRQVSDFPGRNHFELYPSDENEAIFREVVRSRTPFQTVAKPFEYPDHPEWGVTFWDWSLVPILGDKGDVRYLVFSLEDVTEQTRARKELEAANAELERTTSQLRSLAWELTRTEEQERRRLALLLHDHLQQLLVAARLQVETTAHGVGDEKVRSSLDLTVQWLNEAIAESRSLTAELSPPVLYTSGLAAALEWLGQRKAEKYGLLVDVATDAEADPADTDTGVVLFQAVRELLFNVVKHAHTDRAEVRMGLGGDAPDQVEIVVRDHGVGFDATALPSGSSAGFGLFAIRERLGVMGGTLTFASAPGEGTRITIRAPRQRSDEASPAAVASEV